MYQYFLTHGDQRILIFASQNLFKTEAQCLKQYEKGLGNGQYSFDRSRVNQIWSELTLWGLIGRSCPVELIRVLCAYGCSISCFNLQSAFVLEESFTGIRFYLEKPTNGIEVDKPDFYLINGSKLILGDYYKSKGRSEDEVLPRYLSVMENDLCMKVGYFKNTLSYLFYSGYGLMCGSGSKVKMLAQYTPDLIKGADNDVTLFYVS